MPGCRRDGDTSCGDRESCHGNDYDGDSTMTTLLSVHDDSHNTSTQQPQVLPTVVPFTEGLNHLALPTQTVLTSHGGSHKVFNVTNYGNVDGAKISRNMSEPRSMWTLGYDTSDDTTCYSDDDEGEDEGEVDERNNNVQLSPMLRRYADTYNKTATPPLKYKDRTTLLKQQHRRAIDRQEVRLAERGRLYAGRKLHRFIAKTGELNMSVTNVGRRWRYLTDIFTTLMDLRWRYDILLFVLAFVFSWLLFATLWYAISWCHGDADHVDDDEWTPCVDGVDDFVSALLFSIETQHTIGYGTRAVMRKCPDAIVLLMVQSVTGVFIQCLVTGIIFAKLARGKNRAHTIIFSKTAVVCTRHGHPCLMFRVGDMRRSQIIGATLHVLLLKRHLTEHGDVLPTFQHYLKVHTECDDNFFFLAWPTKVIHRITADSPLWTITAESLLTQEMEIVVILEGIVEGTGMTTQVRTSYMPGEIMWGHRLAPLMTYQSENGQHTIDYSQFHGTIPVDMPECSPKEMVQQNTEKQRHQRKRKDAGRSDVGPH